MTKSRESIRTRVMRYLENNSQWLTAAQIGEAINMHPMNVHRIMRTESNRVEKATLDTGQPHGGRFVSVFRIARTGRKYGSTDLALSLAKQHQGLFGQLYWVKHEKILYGVSERQGR